MNRSQRYYLYAWKYYTQSLQAEASGTRLELNDDYMLDHVLDKYFIHCGQRRAGRQKAAMKNV